VEWVETTGKTLDEAKDAALDQLGVAEDDAEFEILAEPKQGLFGRVRGEARVRARIRPTQPRPKVERRDRRKRGAKATDDRPASDDAPPVEKEARPRRRPSAPAAVDGDTPSESSPPAKPARKRSTPAAPAAADAPRSPEADSPQGAPMTESEHDVDFDAHIEIVENFMNGLVEAFGVTASVATEKVDDDNAEVRVTGQDLGLLVGPKGATLSAVQELSRTVVHRQVPGTAAGRVRVDVAGYRQRRKEALERFVQQVAEQVIASGVQKALEPMSPPDRKVVHDTVNTIDGVSTISEGEEPRRRVVLIPDA
jgi:spoIIIJ-associated protein